MNNRKQCIFLLLVFCFLFFNKIDVVFAKTVLYGKEESFDDEATSNLISEFMNDLDFKEINEALSGGTNTDSFSFSDYVLDIMKGNQNLSFSSIFNTIKNSFLSELSGNFSTLTKLLAIAVISAVFTNFSHTFSGGQVADTGFFVTYLLMIGILTATYMSAADLTKEVLGRLIDFMKVMVPVYSVSIVFCANSGTSAIFYQAVMVLITLVDAMLLKVVLPLVHLYTMTKLANYLMQEDFLSKFSDLIGTLVNWILKTVLGLVIGIGTIQSMIAPAIDHVKSKTLMKWAAAIPGIGGLLSTVTDTVLGAGNLLKNAIGVAGVVAVVIICSIPLIKLTIFVLIYKLSSAFIQPIADKRMLSSIGTCAESSMMLLKTVFVGGVLFLIVIVMAAVSTSILV